MIFYYILFYHYYLDKSLVLLTGLFLSAVWRVETILGSNSGELLAVNL